MSMFEDDSSMPLAQSSAATIPQDPPPPAVIPPDRQRANGGRPRDPIWKQYVMSDLHKRHPTGVCRHCGEKKENGKPNENLLVHLARQCLLVPLTIKQHLLRTRGHRRALQPSRSRSTLFVPATTPSSCAQQQVPTESTGGTDDEENDGPSTAPIVDQDEFELELARVFYMCALSFAVIESQVVRRFFQRVLPGMRLPSRHKLSGPLLKRVRDECQAIVVKKIRKQRIVSIVTDGYSNTNSASIMNFMVVAPQMPSVFWSSIATGSAQHDSDYIATELGKVIDEVQATTGARVSGVLTDNASNMVCAVEKLEETRPVLGGGCAAHVINLLLQDVFKFKPVVNIKIKALAITRFVRAHHAVLDHFRSLQDDLPRHRALVTPVQTRWYSMHACLRSVLTNKPVLKGLFGGTDAISKELMERCCYKSTKKRAKVAKLLGYTKDWQFWRDLTALIELMDPIVDSLRVLESDKCYASQVYEEFRGLLANDAYRADDTPYPGTSDMSEQDDEDLDMDFVEQEYEPSLDDPVDPSRFDEEDEEEEDEDEEEEDEDDDDEGEEEEEDEEGEGEERLSLQARFYMAIQKRWNFVHTDAMGMAFLLDPTKDIDGFADGDLEAAIADACKYMKRSNILESMQVEEDDFIAAINKFVAEKTVMDPTKRHNLKKTSPRDWWFSARRRHPLLGELAELVFAIPTSSAASERAWSIFDFIHRKKRNRLSAPKVEQLAYVYINFGTIWNESLDLARIQSYPESFASEDNDGRLNSATQSQVSL